MTGQAQYAVDLVGGLADAGVDVAFISPGSRNTPLTLAFAAEPRIRDISIRDERSAAFVALGYAKATGMPAVVACTSGSAATHYLPAIVEADQSSTPMIVLTADRPVRLRGTGAPQTMNQVNLYGSHVRTYLELDASAGSGGHDDAVALLRTAMTLPPGPVHGNIPFDEPLVPEGRIVAAEPRRAPMDPPRATEPHDIANLLIGRKVLIVVGGRGSAALSRAVNELSSNLSAPVISDPQANITGPNVLAYGDLVVTARDAVKRPIALDLHRPEIVLRLGPIPTSKPLWTWMESSGVHQILIHASRLTDPLKSATTTIDDDPLHVLSGLDVRASDDQAFLEAWMAMDRVAASALEAAVTALPFPNEPAIAATISSNVPDHSILFVASSRPIRDLDAFGSGRRSVTVIANRGVNGIDGMISTALGTALTGTPTTLYIGDVAALHDVSALSEVQRLGVPLRIVVVNNDGGGIFSFLPQARSSAVPSDVYERHWGTPHGLAITTIAESMGLSSRAMSSRRELADALGNPIEAPELIEITTDRATNTESHQIVARTVSIALTGSEHVEQRP